jgi:hypothetical protein
MIVSTLTATDRDHAVDGLDARLERLVHALAFDDRRRVALDRHLEFRLDHALAVDRFAERVHDATEEAGADGHRDDLARAGDAIAFLHLRVVAEKNDADVLFFEVERDPLDAVRELEEFRNLAVLQSMDASDAVTDREDGAEVADGHASIEGLDLLLEDGGDFRRGHTHGGDLS